MSALELTLREKWTPLISLARRLAVPTSIFALALLGYYLSNREPLDWYKHHVYLAEAILQGTLDVGSVGIPAFYQDTVIVEGKEYLPFPPGPALLLLPFVAIWGTGFSQGYFSMVLGAINVVLFWHLLGLINVSRFTKLLLIPFFAFGTVHFYAATTGTLWFYNHVAAVFFLLLAIIFLLRRASPIVPALFLGFAFLSRQPTILAAPFFLYWLWRQNNESIFDGRALLEKQSFAQMGLFLAGLLPFLGFYLWYNVVRFDAPLETGYQTVYEGYTGGGIRYSFYRNQFPDAPHFNLFDVRNIPLHLYTIFLMPPQFHPDWSVLRPSPYGMSVLLTSPAFIYAALVKRKDTLKIAAWIAVGLVSIPLLLHYSQGWVQYGYRFLLDFAPFLLILTALGFEDNRSTTARRIQVLLVVIAIVAGFWGRYWGNELGW